MAKKHFNPENNKKIFQISADFEERSATPAFQAKTEDETEAKEDGTESEFEDRKNSSRSGEKTSENPFRTEFF